MGLGGFFKGIGRGFKKVGKGALWVFKREEVLFASSLIPIPAFDKVVVLVRSLDRKNVPGEVKMLEALQKILPILKECGVDIKKESDIRFIIELALKVAEKKARVTG